MLAQVWQLNDGRLRGTLYYLWGNSSSMPAYKFRYQQKIRNIIPQYITVFSEDEVGMNHVWVIAILAGQTSHAQEQSRPLH